MVMDGGRAPERPSGPNRKEPNAAPDLGVLLKDHPNPVRAVVLSYLDHWLEKVEWSYF